MNWLPHRKLHMYNYFSVGVDAQVTFNFHKARESPFYMISSRILNKVINQNQTNFIKIHVSLFFIKTTIFFILYFLQNQLVSTQNKQILYLCFGTHQVVLPDCVGLEKKINVYLDGEQLDLPELQAVVCLNIDSWGAGVNLWGKLLD